jgi:diaminohydroxyphosphoribosylaminopyrimidine deaminase/5-amino-6-(5-phosphoribosylamino)uracil reductase
MSTRVPIEDLTYLQRCYQLARLAGKDTKSNPLVGAVIVAANRVIGEGYHKCYGGPHAEVEAIASVKADDRYLLATSTIYVSLEPCNHTGKTGPCTHAIIAAGIKKVVIGSVDPHELVAGSGIAYLRENGCEVIIADDLGAKELIRPFVVHQQKRPYVILKWAQSLEGYIGAKDHQVWLTHHRTSILTHKWRSEVDAIMIGSKTATIDQPSLDTRNYPGHSPVRVVLDRTATAYKHLKDSSTKTIVLNELLESKDIDHLIFTKVQDVRNLHDILNKLYLEGVCYLLVEGGAQVLQSFIDQELWDEARIIMTNTSLQNGIKSPRINGIVVERFPIATDIITILRP